MQYKGLKALIIGLWDCSTGILFVQAPVLGGKGLACRYFSPPERRLAPSF